MGQQFYVIRNNPAPGTPAFAAKEERDRAKAAKHGVAEPEPAADAGTTATETRRPAPRQQPKRMTRAERRAAANKQQTKGGSK